ncbi:RagB/SusD family nutrient uptake outer membrane protein [Flammeovirga pectinis]|uniref:RagB/SusD family nutrient uptake outer membrane protein n=1 Tax=Flammeovirga pectinis TaxID=2494373 RepID=A0A3Q9FUS4_9BACT|nr:RagB/SusD family nutrient uptake outer membrane protein [Flammeovirga pectinis]AZQ65571.1 RagB/SusD family nutrient uptake outer membrane protein [Flammeovirga pectinis]
MIKINNKLTVVGALCLSMLSGCGDKFLTQENLTEVSTDTYYANSGEIFEALTGVYNALPTEGGRDNPTLVANVMSDDCFGGGGPDDPDVQAMDNFQNNVENKYAELWGNSYKGIFRVNTIIANFENSVFEDEDVKNQLLGEAHFLRAFYYLRLAQFFGEAPLILKPEPTDNPKASADELFGQIASDFKMAIDVMPANKYSSDMNGRATKWSAEGMMARAFLFYTGKYNKASIALPDGSTLSKDQVKTWIDDCIKNSGHDLIDDFRNIWPYSYANEDYAYAKDNNLSWVDDASGNEEVLFSVKYSILGANDGNGSLSYSNQLVLYTAMRGQDGLLPFGMGWGWGPANGDLWNSYEDGDLRKEGSIISVENPTEGISDDYVWGQWDCFHETGYWNKKYTPIVVNTLDPDGNTIVKGMFYDLYGSPDDFQTWNIQDEMLLRFSDVLLMAAELGVNANENFNRVRTRAGLGAKDPSLANIKAERRHELAFEGLRYFDLQRWGDAEAVINKSNGTIVKTRNIDTPYEVNYRPETNGFLPIPESELRLSGGVLVQNPGW